MSKQHRYLLGLITLASVVTIVFQCFWLAGNYQHEKENFIAYAERLLFESMQEERELQFRRAYPEAYQSVKKGDFVRSRQLFYSHVNEKEKVSTLAIRGIPATPLKVDTVAKDPLHIQLLPTALMQLDFQALQKRYKEKLGADLEQTFFLDTLHIRRDETISTAPGPAMPLPAMPIRGGLTPGARHLPIAFGKPNQKIMASFPIQATTMMLNPANDLFLSLYLKTPTWWILKHLAWALLSSLLLTALTIGCLVYLLYTIFKQKKLADIKNDFVNNMTHELKTPLATVLAATESLQQFDRWGNQQKVNLYLQMTHRAATHLTHLIDQILHLAVGEQGGMHLQTELIDSHQLLPQLIETYQIINQHQITLQMEKEMPPVKVDKIHMANAINNLLDNAIKYTLDPVQIRITSSVVDNQWVLSVTDNGIGIAAADIKHIFQPFFRVPTGNIHRIKGFGLGLHYVKQVVNRHRGQIQVDSTLGKGTTFTISLPLSI